MLSRNSSRQQLNAPATHEDSEDLTQARNKQQGLPKSELFEEREKLKADIMRMKGGGGAGAGRDSQDSEEDQLANTNASNFTIALGKYSLVS